MMEKGSLTLPLPPPQRMACCWDAHSPVLHAQFCLNRILCLSKKWCFLRGFRFSSNWLIVTLGGEGAAQASLPPQGCWRKIEGLCRCGHRATQWPGTSPPPPPSRERVGSGSGRALGPQGLLMGVGVCVLFWTASSQETHSVTVFSLQSWFTKLKIAGEHILSASTLRGQESVLSAFSEEETEPLWWGDTRSLDCQPSKILETLPPPHSCLWGWSRDLKKPDSSVEQL